METGSLHATRSFDAPANPPNSQEKSEREITPGEEITNRGRVSANQEKTSGIQITPSNAGGDGPNASRLSSNQGRKLSGTGSLSNAPGRVSATEAKASASGGKQAGTPGRQSSIEGRTSLTGSKKPSIEGKISAVESKKSTDEGRISTVESKKSTGEGRISTVGSKKSITEGRLSTTGGKMSTTEAGMAAVGSKISTTEGRMSTVGSKPTVASSATRQSTAEGRVSTSAGKISTSAGKLSPSAARSSADAGGASSISGKLSFAVERKSTAEGRLSTMESRQSTGEGRLSTTGRGSTFDGKPSTTSGGFSADDARMSRNMDKAYSAQMSKPFDTDGTATTMDDTVHYMSPVSPISMRSDYEGDYAIDYLRFLGPVIGQEGSVSFKSSTVSCVEPELQRTIAIVQPDAMKYEDVVMRAVTEAGFSTISKRYIHFTPEQVSEFYCQYYGSPSFPYQVVSMSVGPVLVLSLADVNAVAKWRDMVGPDRIIREEWFVPMSMRVRFGLQELIPNAVHASENLEDANKENRYIYPRSVLEPFIHEQDKVNDYCGKYVNPTLLDGLTALVKTKPIDPIMYLAEWLLRNNPYQPQFTKDINLLPT